MQQGQWNGGIRGARGQEGQGPGARGARGPGAMGQEGQGGQRARGDGGPRVRGAIVHPFFVLIKISFIYIVIFTLRGAQEARVLGGQGSRRPGV